MLNDGSAHAQRRVETDGNIRNGGCDGKRLKFDDEEEELPESMFDLSKPNTGREENDTPSPAVRLPKRSHTKVDENEDVRVGVLRRLFENENRNTRLMFF